MADVFISYARSTADQAQLMAESLRGLGYSVWIDADLPAHRTYGSVIEEQLMAAKAAVVIWSADAVKSEWVFSEANRARENRKLVQVAVDQTRLPMPFDAIQCADLASGIGDPLAPGWRKVVESVAALVGAAPQAPAAGEADASAASSLEPLLAVLAFDNLSGDPEMAYFSDGVSEEIQETVARGTDLKVIGRASSFQYRGIDKAAKRVAAELHATHVLDGSVRRSGPRVRISAQLIGCAREITLWSDRFDRDLSDVFALQDEIAGAVAGALKAVFAPAAKAQAVDPAAYDLYLQARGVLDGPGEIAANRIEAIGLLEQAVALAPEFARAWGRLAHMRAWRLRNIENEQPYAVLRAGVVEAAATALRLNPDLGNPYQALAELEPFGNYAERETLHYKALAATANDPDVLIAARHFFEGIGCCGEALTYAKRAFDLDAMQFEVASGYFRSLESVGRYEESVPVQDRVLTLWPANWLGVLSAMVSAYCAGDSVRFDDLTTNIQAAGALPPLLGDAIAVGRHMRTPDPQFAQTYLEQTRASVARTKTLTIASFMFLCRLGWTDEAFELIDLASFDYIFDAERHWAARDATGRIFSLTLNGPTLRDPRFPRLCAKLGLCAYWVKSGRWPDCAEEGLLPYDFKAECRKLAQ